MRQLLIVDQWAVMEIDGELQGGVLMEDPKTGAQYFLQTDEPEKASAFIMEATT